MYSVHWDYINTLMKLEVKNHQENPAEEPQDLIDFYLEQLFESGAQRRRSGAPIALNEADVPPRKKSADGGSVLDLCQLSYCMKSPADVDLATEANRATRLGW
ncbi:hypothetical protein NDU88_009549 [Pleurodeles waltl]|uniref:Uncharacterized protein n=1 Tax=Pleurodeles waltl TaxID=8319 RepID=A0AAV7NZY5_PLEWA|nr:hypothetical protein NDU88_009549 [Pleurodeles waltl]